MSQDLNEQLARIDRFFAIKKTLYDSLHVNAELSKEFRLILIEASQIEAVEGFSDLLVHLDAARTILSKISFE